jgi:hypothetical protein
MKQRNTNVHASGAVTTSSRKRPSLRHQGRDILLEQQEGTGTKRIHKKRWKETDKITFVRCYI